MSKSNVTMFFTPADLLNFPSWQPAFLGRQCSVPVRLAWHSSSSEHPLKNALSAQNYSFSFHWVSLHLHLPVLSACCCSVCRQCLQCDGLLARSWGTRKKPHSQGARGQNPVNRPWLSRVISAAPLCVNPRVPARGIEEAFPRQWPH